MGQTEQGMQTMLSRILDHISLESVRATWEAGLYLYRTDFPVQLDAKVACWYGEKEGHMKKAIQKLRKVYPKLTVPCIDKKLSSIQTELDANTNMTRRLQSRKAELYERYRAGRISREKFADIQKTDSEKLARLSSRAEEIKRLLVEHYESRGNLARGKISRSDHPA